MVVYLWFGMAFGYPRISHKSQAIDNGSKCSSHICSSLGYIKVKKPHLSLSCACHCDSHLKQSLLVALILNQGLPKMFLERIFILSLKMFYG